MSTKYEFLGIKQPNNGWYNAKPTNQPVKIMAGSITALLISVTSTNCYSERQARLKDLFPGQGDFRITVKELYFFV